MLVVNADDFGLTVDVNRGIVDAHTRGILTATTLMANGSAFDDAVRRASQNPTLDIGVHLVLIGGRSVLKPERMLPATPTELLRSLLAGKTPLYEELRAQIQRILAAGLRPTHLDTHKHTHLVPAVLRVVARLGDEFDIRWVRRPFDLPLQGGVSQVPVAVRAVSGSLNVVRSRFHRVLTQAGCRFTDHFAGFALTGRFLAGDLVRLIGSLPQGSTEFMCHPGYCTSELRDAATRLKESRERELAALTDPSVRAALAAASVELTGFPGLDMPQAN
jgi:chitin disaccharide deacetylase